MDARDTVLGSLDHSLPQHESTDGACLPGSLELFHDRDELVLELVAPDWLLPSNNVRCWGLFWRDWMTRVVDHCLDPTTIGGRTLSDVSLLKSSTVLADVEREMLRTLQLRPTAIEDIFPVSPLQAGLLVAMIQEPAEYVLQSVIDIHGAFSFTEFQACWTQLALDIPTLRTCFVSTVHGLYQAVTRDEWSEWHLKADDEVWPHDEVTARTKAWMDMDRRRGFSLTSKSFHRFTGVHVSDGRLRLVWTFHHALLDGWSISLLQDKLLAMCYGTTHLLSLTLFKEHIAWLAQQDVEP
ncbi:hypothetical protein As57867_006867, partial [Aphanomyces stellatus]